MSKRYWIHSILVATSLLLAVLLAACEGTGGAQEASGPSPGAAAPSDSVAARLTSEARQPVNELIGEAALEDMRAGRGQCPVHATPEGLARVMVESIEVAYYAPPAPMAEAYYKPVYLFHVRMADGTTGEWLLSAFDA